MDAGQKMKWAQTKVRAGDTLQTIASRYNVAPEEIVEANGVKWGIQPINAWVIKTGGKWLPQSGDAVPGSPTGGWAVFTDRSTILLPARCACKNQTPVAKLVLVGILGFAVAKFTSSKGR